MYSYFAVIQPKIIKRIETEEKKNKSQWYIYAYKMYEKCVMLLYIYTLFILCGGLMQICAHP